MLKDVRIADRLRFYGIRENHRGFPVDKDIRVFGGDTETVKGRLHTVQAVSEGEELFAYTDPAGGFKRFCDWIDARALDKGVNLVFIHNLKFDITVLLQTHHQELFDQYNEITLDKDGYNVRMFYGRVNFVTVRRDLGAFVCKACGELPGSAVKLVGRLFYCANPIHGDPTPVRKKYGPTVKWIDSAAFCPPGSKSLSAALKIYGVSYKKMNAPEGLGDRALCDTYFERYAMNDARAEEALGRAILNVHKEYDVTPCVSLPQLAGRVLRHHFFKKDESFSFPPERCRLAAELSYHAGKNGMYVAPGVYEDVYEYDINSAFPAAMAAMPQIVKGKYRHVKKYRRGVMGIYRLSGKVNESCKYPVVFDAGFKPVRGVYKDEWITGYEYEILRQAPGNRYKIKEGWIWDHDKTYAHSPLGEFVDKFWNLKSKAPKGPSRDTYKNILNSLYGKFAACVEKRTVENTLVGKRHVDSEEGGSYYVSGALYHPFIATQITGYVRARLWELEMSGHAFHAATDSIKSKIDLPDSQGLGGIKKEVYGRCYLFRNKLYLHFAKTNRLCGHNLESGWLYLRREEADALADVGAAHYTGKAWDSEEEIFRGKLFEDGQHLCKIGLHGFKGSAFFLYENRHKLLKDGYLDYSYSHMTQLREGWKRNETVCSMTERTERMILKACTGLPSVV